jgi:hypothetical protein
VSNGAGLAEPRLVLVPTSCCEPIRLHLHLHLPFPSFLTTACAHCCLRLSPVARGRTTSCGHDRLHQPARSQRWRPLRFQLAVTQHLSLVANWLLRTVVQRERQRCTRQEGEVYEAHR